MANDNNPINNPCLYVRPAPGYECDPASGMLVPIGGGGVIDTGGGGVPTSVNGAIAWARANPVPTLAIAGVALFFLSKMSK